MNHAVRPESKNRPIEGGRGRAVDRIGVHSVNKKLMLQLPRHCEILVEVAIVRGLLAPCARICWSPNLPFSALFLAQTFCFWAFERKTLSWKKTFLLLYEYLYFNNYSGML